MTRIVAFTRVRRAGLAALCGIVVTWLGGCVSLLPKTPPVQLYRFGAVDTPPTPAATPSAEPAPAAFPSTVALSQVALPVAAQGDGILTATGDQAAYIGGARWAAPATLIFQEDVQRAFDAGARRTRLVDRGGIGAADALLRLDVSRFEVRYDLQAPTAAPAVLVTVRATLTRPDGHLAQQRVFSRDLPAPQNRVGAIVATFGRAVDETLAEVVDWTEQTAPGLAPTPQPVPSAQVPSRTP